VNRFEGRDDLFQFLTSRFRAITEREGIDSDAVDICAKTLTVREAIGDTKRRDFPIITGKEVVIEADYRGTKGQAFTDAPSDFRGTLREITELDFRHDLHAPGLFVATLNAVMSSLGLAGSAIHCRDEGPELCAAALADRIEKDHRPRRVLLIGYQPAMLQRLSEKFELRVFDLNEMNIGTVHHGVEIEDGNASMSRDWLNDWPDILLVTGSTLCNGTLIHFLDLEKPTYFYGMTIAGAAPLLGLKRLCFADRF